MIDENRRKVIEKLKIYESKLLDISRKNNLINFRDVKSSTLEIIAPDINEIFEKIFLHNFSYRVFNDPSKKTKKENSEYEAEIIDIQNNDNNALINPTSLSKVVTTSVFEYEDEKEKYYQKYKNKISKSQVLLFNYYFDANKTNVILNKLRLNSKTIMQEKGINSLFIAFGFLKWFESSNSAFPCKSPIILIPISIIKENDKFTIAKFDDPILNQNLYFSLKNKFSITIPQYNNQILSEYFNELKKSVPTNWEICKEAKISLFNYNKITMYQDLKNYIDIFANNENISRLLGEKNSDFNGYFTEEEIQEIDKRKNSFLLQHNILDADFSQAQAIEMAKTGKSFIIQGPPGTGKSQTITNIIGELLFLGKKILFLSEKKSALEIIYSNLKKTKLQNLCLELHSSKSNKKDFIENIYNTISNKQQSTIKKENISDRNILKRLVNKINNYQEKLHELCPPTNETLYQLIHSSIYFNNLINIKNKYCDLVLIIQNQEISYDDFIQLLSKYVEYEKLTKYNIDNFPLYEVLITDFSALYINNFKNLLKDYEQKIQKILDLLKKDDLNKIDFLDKNLSKFVGEYLKISKVDFKILKNIVDTVEEIEKIEEENNKLKNRLNCDYDNDIYQENVQEIFDNYVDRSWFSRTFSFKFRKLHKKIFSYKNKANKENDYSENVSDLKIILRIKENKDKINDLIRLSNLKKDFDLNDINENFKNNMSNLYDISLTNADLMGFYYDYVEIQTKILEYFEQNSIINLTFAEKLNFVKKIINVLKNNDVTYLINLMKYKKILIQINKNNLKEFIKKLIELKIPTSKFIECYKAVYYKYWADTYLNRSELFSYTRELHDSDIDKFIVLDKNQIETNQKFILDKFNNNHNDFNSRQIILREYKKKSHKKAIREILELIGDYIQKIKPVFLMSPLSVSNFLPIDFNFDVVIFDEASQIFPEDTLGAICRSKQMIVVGDPKQMPPTNFFLAKDDDEENDEEIEIYESILDLCSTIFPVKKLLVHYRSRSENLINFSNKNFYNGELITFPSIYENKEDFGIEFIYVSNGVLDANTTNIYEAKKIIELIFEHFKKNPERSLGVITLNIKQRDLIMKLLEKERIKNKSFENFFDENIKEPFFIKNLENVQGDERDTIFLSICYAKNSIGKFYNRFGPINGVGGERRLNVAITRAKFNMKVVSSIHGTDIDLTKISNLGPKLLHDYLDYAEFRTFNNINQNIIVNNDKKFDSVFEEEVYNFLVAKGFSVDTQVGCCNYRIDLALKKPDSSNYVLAIECDGASYHSSNSTRDRDRYRQMILEGLQWKFYRIWSTSWFQDNKGEKEKLIKACNNALK